jgi:hypothetical protein
MNGLAAALPRLVRAYVERALPPHAPTPETVRVTQAGEMWLKPGGGARPFTAVQDYAVRDVAFSWRASFPLAPLLSLRVLDRYTTGVGALEGRVLGLVPVMRQSGPETSLGEALRYLAELVWMPQAMGANSQLEWRELDERSVEVATRSAPARAAVTLQFDAAGDVASARCEDRPYRQGTSFVPRPWAGTFSEYGTLGGVRLPTRGEVRWELPEGPFTYWRGTITSLELDPADA